jgi:hypothetical protein
MTTPGINSPGREIRGLQHVQVIRRDERTVLPPWLDPLSLAAGVAIGGFGWAWVVPSLGAFLADTAVASIVVSASIGVTALLVARAVPTLARRPFAEFRKPRFRQVAAALGPGEWIQAHAGGAEGKGPDVLRFALANSLSEQLGLRQTPLVETLADALLAIDAGETGVAILDELATLATKDEIPGPNVDPASRQCQEERIAEGLKEFRARNFGFSGKHGALASAHAYGETRLLGALAQARRHQIVPTADFAWLSRHHWPLWMAACSLGSTGTVPDALGILAHYQAEREASRRLETPQVSAAVEALLAAAALDDADKAGPATVDEDWVAAEAPAEAKA